MAPINWLANISCGVIPILYTRPRSQPAKTGDGRPFMVPWHYESGIIDPKNVVIEKVWRNKANKILNKQLIEQTRSQ